MKASKAMILAAKTGDRLDINATTNMEDAAGAYYHATGSPGDMEDAAEDWEAAARDARVSEETIATVRAAVRREVGQADRALYALPQDC